MAQKTYFNHDVKDKSHNGTIVAILNNRMTTWLPWETKIRCGRNMYTAGTGRPVAGEGRRFIECPFYGDCLMHAAKHNWKAWTCAKCPNLKLDLVCKKLKFISPYYQILSEIYPQFRTKYEPAMSNLDLEHWMRVVDAPTCDKCHSE